MSLAVLVDAENMPASRFEFIRNRVDELGRPAIFRLFADFTNPSHAAWLDIARRQGLETVFQPSSGTGKNSADIAMVIHAMDILHSGRFTRLCLVSTDRDFVFLAQRLRAAGLAVYGIGRQSDNGLAASCTAFYPVPETARPAVAAPKTPSPAPKPSTQAPTTPDPAPPELPALIARIAADRGTDGWVPLSTAAHALRELAPHLADRYLGKGRFLKNLRAMGLVTERKAQAGLEIRPRAGNRPVARPA